MDHFSKAVERARNENQSVRTWMQAETRAPAAPEVPLQADVRTIKLDPDRLRASHVLLFPDQEDLAAVDVFRLLRTRVLLQMRANSWTRIGITSAGDREGKSLTAINLASSIARSGPESVMLIDADLRKPNVAETLGFESEYGLVDHLADGIPITDIVVRPEGEPRLSLLPGRRVGRHLDIPELVGSRAMADLLAYTGRLKSTVTIVDLPPVLVGDDVIAVGPNLDALLLVVEEGRTDVDELRKTVELTSRFNILGSVLNKSRQSLGRFKSYYYHGH
jgi:Mrp family chromosome partitioning ATPase